MIFESVAIESKASQEKEDLDKVLRIVAPYEPKVVLEIGMWKGYSAENWIKAFNPELLITLERDHKHEDGTYFEQESQKEFYHYLWDIDSTKDETVEQVKQLLNGKQVDFMFIDGGHRFDNVYQDFYKYINLVKEGGIVAFHDILYTSYECQANLLWEELKKTYDYVEINCGQGSTGYGLLFNVERKPKTVSGLHQ